VASNVPVYVPSGTARDNVGPQSAVISVSELVHRYEQRTALDGISFEVHGAEIFGLLGPNGSGKTTLFRILSTLMLPTGGRAQILGCDVARDANRLRHELAWYFRRKASM
jgi:ABC-2 type transport system ATP-binding protein